MTYRLPPLNALRAFEAAARHLSFKSAAGELRVTPGAVSQQVRSLERLLGLALFERVHQGLMLTEAGQRYLTPLRHAFDVISIATQSVAPREAGTPLVVAAPPEFAVNWLLPALDGFQAMHPSLTLKIAEASGPDAVLRGRAAVAILPGLSSHPELTATHLVDDLRFPVEAPTAVAPARTLRETLRDATLLVADDERLWRQALGGDGMPAFDALRRIAFARRDLAVRAAELGRGVVLASSVEDTAALATGRLVPVAGGPIVRVSRWYALCPPGRLDCPEERALLDWLVRAGHTEATAERSPAGRSSSAA
ncbi:LysR family transcriptional regulator [Thalassobaculum sp.]|uniref:LysR family transcriptional regulator n=1 Tax=Thalassobaculum sp. TaxID=2022740 RepID=UPI0032EE52B9